MEELLDPVTGAFGVKQKDVLNKTHQPIFPDAVYLLRRAVNLSLKKVSTLAGVSSSQKSRTQSSIERDTHTGPLEDLMRRYKTSSDPTLLL